MDVPSSVLVGKSGGVSKEQGRRFGRVPNDLVEMFGEDSKSWEIKRGEGSRRLERKYGGG